jgi:hydroxymethylglutaryl-CoA lyase
MRADQTGARSAARSEPRLPARVILRDVTLRDGLQSEKALLSLGQKISLARQVREAGIRELEVTAFVSPRRVPAMADAEELLACLAGETGITCSALVFNRQGLERAVRARAPQIAVFVSASDAQSRSNTGLGTEEALREALEVLSAARHSGTGARAGVICAFGCTLEGQVPESRVLDIVAALNAASPAELTLADTAGTGDPRQVAARVSACRRIIGDRRLSLHLHNANGWAFANLLAALQVGVEVYDVTVGGLGGCPFLPGAAGNLPADRVASFLEALGIESGVSLPPILQAQRDLERLLGRLLSAPAADARTCG